MILHELTGTEQNPIYHGLATSNGERQFSFLKSVIEAAVAANQYFLSQTILKALNFHAIACLHPYAGEFRPIDVHVVDNNSGEVTYQAPEPHRVHAQMDNFINVVNAAWHQSEPVPLAAYVMWRLCAIHPFINGNGRTARAAAYFVVCAKSGGLLPGDEVMIPAMRTHPNYYDALRYADRTFDLTHVQEVIRESLEAQLASAGQPAQV